MILIGLGSSQPFCGRDSLSVVQNAQRALAQLGQVQSSSRFYRTPAWPDPADPPFVNAVLSFTTGLSPSALLAALHAVEAGFGRRRSVRNAPRTLDLDLLSYHEVVSAGGIGHPILPHPGIETRDFVLAPLCDIAPDWLHPVSGRRARASLAALSENNAVAIAPEAS